MTEDFQQQADKLKEANNAQLNNEDQSKVNQLLTDIDQKLNTIKDKINSLFDN